MCFIHRIFKFKEINTGQLSGGQKQQAHIARALYQQTVLMVLDEPLKPLCLLSVQLRLHALSRSSVSWVLSV
ncbi:ATP-binding cassette domain-containing protein [Vibrio penaeicida]|uniref:ATP-binding cassette domain-containing protein n=1 Tax=Vibrio penaeicida TaxID=104609 RepID=UPI001F013CCE|nr:ATP-binding cassette domain-containing protein [Vibrio penaeicida]